VFNSAVKRLSDINLELCNINVELHIGVVTSNCMPTRYIKMGLFTSSWNLSRKAHVLVHDAI
jgi:hypothetical protein